MHARVYAQSLEMLSTCHVQTCCVLCRMPLSIIYVSEDCLGLIKNLPMDIAFGGDLNEEATSKDACRRLRSAIEKTNDIVLFGEVDGVAAAEEIATNVLYELAKNEFMQSKEIDKKLKGNVHVRHIDSIGIKKKFDGKY